MISERPFEEDINEKDIELEWAVESLLVPDLNPVVESARFVHQQTNLVKLNDDGIQAAAHYVKQKLEAETYSPLSWRLHPLHLVPPPTYSRNDPRCKATLDWIFLISSLNFSFWSELEGRSDRYGVEWREGWDSQCSQIMVHTGYWSLVAAINRALDEGIPITDPQFYSDPVSCPDSVIEDMFRPAPGCAEAVPLLRERISVMREVGLALCQLYNGSFQGFIEEFQKTYDNCGTALQLVQMVTDVFPSFRDEVLFQGRQVFFWKRAQILVAETWAAFYPPEPVPASASSPLPHPFFPTGVHQLTMFADYRVPQILHHLRILNYPPALLRVLKTHTYVSSGSREELSIRATSILAVEAIRDAIITAMKPETGAKEEKDVVRRNVSSVIIDFYLWDLAKRVEQGEESIEGVDTQEMVPAHRTRSIWY